MVQYKVDTLQSIVQKRELVIAELEKDFATIQERIKEKPNDGDIVREYVRKNDLKEMRDEINKRLSSIESVIREISLTIKK